MGKLFHIRPTKNYGLTNQKLFANYGSVPVVVNSSQNNGIGGFVDLEPTERGNMITFSDTTTSDSIFYQPNDFIGYSHVQGMFPYEEWNKYSLLYFVICFRTATKGKFDYGNKFNRDKAKEILVTIPYHNNKIAFKYMENYIKALEAERIETLEAERIETLEAYLTVTNLRDYHLTKNDEKVLDKFAKLSDTKSRVEESEVFRLSPVTMLTLFPNIHQGRRLKKDDQINGDLPFVMAGTTNTGVVRNIGNDVRIFPKHSLTIDIFGNTFYRGYEFGAGDDTGVFWNDKIKDSKVLLYLKTIIEKSLAGKYDFGSKLRASQTHNFQFDIPQIKNKIDYTFMSDFIRAVEKLVIKDLVIWADKKLLRLRK
ncbi:putative type IIS restriction enzyme [Streptococcus pneumoniae]|uniref:Type IIS restriction enzyme n=1 Tax=Streptococcus pneumoniae TaxID=1313 RepID=A0AA86X5X6_STREE|nr:putative type IIS restriction enzyme [Streptococcus pneumoniae]CIS69186.1 putative type IIS restriction enzyme [Streptococcus pneumoniae]